MPDAPRPTDGDIDARLRAAGERLRSTAPDATRPIDGTVDGTSAGRSRRAWYAGGTALAVAAAVIVAFVVLPSTGDETIREVPADRPTDDPEQPAEDETLDDETDDGPPASIDDLAEPSPSDPPTIDDGPASIAGAAEFADWDGQGGLCQVLRLDEPLDEDEIGLCVTGFQIDVGVTAYVRSQGVEWSMHLSRNSLGGLETRSGSGWLRFDDAACGPPIHDVPDDRWVMVSHCGAVGAALYTLLPTSPAGSATHLVGAMDAETHDTVFLDTLAIDEARTDRAPDQLIALSAVGVRGAPVSCLIVAPARASRWFESCFGDDEPQHGRLFLYAGSPYGVDLDGDTTRLIPLVFENTLPANGCSERALSDTLVAIEDFFPGAILSGLACAAATDVFETSERDELVSATVASMFARPGPIDGAMFQLERSSTGNLEVVDVGTGFEPEPWPLSIPPWRIHPLDDDRLSPIDVTTQLREAVPGPGSRDELRMAVSNHLAEIHPTEGAPAHTVEIVAPLPLLVAPNVTFLDDSAPSGTYYVWLQEAFGDEFETTDQIFRIGRAFLVNRCGRGVTEVDGVRLCV